VKEIRMMTLRLAIFTLAIAATMGAPARAYETETGTGVICDTRGQAERLAMLLDQDANAAIKTVNAEARDPTACTAVNVVYVRGAKVATARNKAGTFDIVEILAVGIATRSGMRSTNPATYFTLFKIEEQMA
jgi:hypothetical protein